MSANWIYVFRRAADQISVFVLLLVCASLAAARPLVDLAKTADLIVVGSAVSVSGAVPDSTIVVGVDRVLKGSYSGTTILARIEGRRLSGHVPRDVLGVWFFTQEKAGGWKCIPARSLGQDVSVFTLMYPVLASLPAGLRYDQKVSLLDKLVHEVGGAAGVEGFDSLPYTLADAIGGFDSSAVRKVLQYRAAHGTPEAKAGAVASLVARGDDTGLVLLMEDRATLSASAGWNRIVDGLAFSFRNTDAESTGLLVRIASDSTAPDDLRRAAIRSLRAVHTEATISFLAGLLDSADASLRMEAVFGLSAFANGCPPQTPQNVASMEYLQFRNPSPYRTDLTRKHFAFGRGSKIDEARLVAFWKSWWASHRSDFDAGM